MFLSYLYLLFLTTVVSNLWVGRPKWIYGEDMVLTKTWKHATHDYNFSQHPSNLFFVDYVISLLTDNSCDTDCLIIPVIPDN